jgi:Trk K+ transport system NAD-binding subunit
VKVTVVGLGHVGTPTTACAASGGHNVRGVDVDVAQVSEICIGRGAGGRTGPGFAGRTVGSRWSRCM